MKEGLTLCKWKTTKLKPDQYNNWISVFAGVLSFPRRQNKADAEIVNGGRGSIEIETPKIKFRYKILNYTPIISEDSLIEVNFFYRGCFKLRQ